MREKIKNRILELRQELNAGHQSLRELDARSAEVRSQMLRINGAIQVLEELLGAEPAATSGADPMLRTVPR
jgi:chromosome segregation ATPase